MTKVTQGVCESPGNVQPAPQVPTQVRHISQVCTELVAKALLLGSWKQEGPKAQEIGAVDLAGLAGVCWPFFWKSVPFFFNLSGLRCELGWGNEKEYTE